MSEDFTLEQVQALDHARARTINGSGSRWSRCTTTASN